jgi:hypothetical protein
LLLIRLERTTKSKLAVVGGIDLTVAGWIHSSQECVSAINCRSSRPFPQSGVTSQQENLSRRHHAYLVGLAAVTKEGRIIVHNLT